MKVKVIGTEHMQGISKTTKKPYDNTVVHFTRKSRYATGEVGDKVFLPYVEFPPESIAVGAVYNVDYDSRGFCVDFNKV